MRYIVAWRKEAENQLAALWIRALNKTAIADYIHQIEKILERDPHEQGESRNENTRLAFFRPLAVRYAVDDEAKLVTVIAIKWVGR
jgi:hypothetical protein